MNWLVETLFPLVLYIVYSILNSLHSIALMRAPGVTLEEVARPIENVLIDAENKLEFLKSGKVLLSHLMCDSWFLDWFWPFWKRLEYKVDTTFDDDYTKSTKNWWSIKTCCIAALIIVFALFMSDMSLVSPLRNILVRPDSEWSYVLVLSVTTFFALGVGKLVGRVFYRLALHVVLWVMVVLSPIYMALDASKQHVLQQAAKKLDDPDGVTTLKLLGDLRTYVEAKVGASSDGAVGAVEEKVRRVMPAVFDASQMPSTLKGDTITQAITNTYNGLFDEVLTHNRERLAEYLIGDGRKVGKLIYDVTKSPITSMVRFAILDARSSQLVVCLLIACFVVSGGFNFASSFLEVDEEIDQEGAEGSVFAKMIYLCLLVALYVFIYSMLLLGLRQAGLVAVSAMGRSKTVMGEAMVAFRSLIAHEVLGTGHQYTLPKKVEFLKPLQSWLGESAIVSLVVPVIATVVVGVYVFMTRDAASDNNDGMHVGKPGLPGLPGLSHYLESTKTVAMVCVVLVILYRFFSTFKES